MLSRRPSQLLSRFAASICRHPARYLLVALAVAGASFAVASNLTFQSSYLALLPEGAPEVAAIHEVRRHTGGTSELVIAVGGPRKGRLPFGRRIVERLEASPWVEWAQVEQPTGFIQDRALYLLPGRDVRALQRALDDEVERARARANPLFVDLEQDGDQEAQRLARLRELDAEQRRREAALAPVRETSDGRYLLVMVKPRSASTQLGRAREVFAGIQREVEAARQGSRAPVRYAGSLVLSLHDNRTMSRDFTVASVVALGLAMILITFTTRRLSAVAVIGAPLVAGLAATLAFATVAIGHLNLVSGFLVAALVGLGIDFGIHLYLRFLDERIEVYDQREAMGRAIRATFGASLTAASTTSVAFLALLAADFRGFSEYGLIASVGVMLALATTYLLLPPLVLLLGRLPWVRRRAGQVDARGRRRLRNTRQLARPLAWLMLAAGLGFVALSAGSLGRVEFRNKFKQLRGQSEALAFSDYISDEIGGSLSPAVLMVDDLEQARAVERALGRRARDPRSPIARAVSLASLVPADQERRALLVGRIERTVGTILDTGDLSAADRDRLVRLQRLTGAAPWTAAEVPEELRRRLVARTGKHFVLAWPRHELADDRRIARWAASLDAVTAELAEQGVAPLVLDENLVASRVLALIRTDGPRVMALSFAAVLLLLALDFRRLDRVLLVGATVGAGLVSMLGVMALFEIDINLFNAVVLPTILGIGIDNAVHLQHAYAARGRGSVALVVATTGRAALLSSATTAIGFGSAILAQHGGIRQMGLLALIGIGCSFAASTILFPIVLRLLERRPREPAAAPVLQGAARRDSVDALSATSPGNLRP